jgi:uncharacterized protein YdeI (YjbR/CyaY-like superfamily)
LHSGSDGIRTCDQGYVGSVIENYALFGIKLLYMEINTAIDLKDNQEWRKWLKHNHDQATEVWLVIFKKHSEQSGLRYDEALEEALCFGWIDGKMKSIDRYKFFLRFSPRKSKSLWSQRNKDKAEKLIAQGRMATAGLVRIETAKKNGTWEEAYTNKKKDEIPTDLEAVLLENPTAWLNFQQFANSYRNMYIGWVISAKTESTRKRRIEEVVKRSVSNKKPGIE